MSKAFTSSKTGSAAHPGLPGRDYHSPEDRFLRDFAERYLAERGPA